MLATIQPTTLPHQASYRAAEVLAESVSDRLREDGYDEVVIRNPGAFPVRDIGITVTTELERRGIDSYVADGIVPYLTPKRNAELAPGAPEIWIVDGRAPEPPVPGAVPIATWSPDEETLAELDEVDRSIADTVADAGSITTTDRADVVIPPLLRGWPEVAAAYEDDPASLVDAPPAVLESLYTTGLVQFPVLPPATSLALGNHRAGHPITAYLVA